MNPLWESCAESFTENPHAGAEAGIDTNPAWDHADFMLRAFVFLVLSIAMVSAEEPAGGQKLPDEAARIKQEYQQDVERAVRPMRERYLSNLKRLLDDATRNGKLNEALAIKAEIDNASAGTADATDSIEEFEKRFTAVKWTWNNAWGVTFNSNGTADRGLTWKSVKPYTIEYKYPDGNHGTIVFERNLSKAVINEINTSGKKNPLTLYRAKN